MYESIVNCKQFCVLIKQFRILFRSDNKYSGSQPSDVHLSSSVIFYRAATLQNNGSDLSLTAVCVAVGDDSHVKMNTHNTIRATRKLIGASRVVAVSGGVSLCLSG